MNYHDKEYLNMIMIYPINNSVMASKIKKMNADNWEIRLWHCINVKKNFFFAILVTQVTNRNANMKGIAARITKKKIRRKKKNQHLSLSISGKVFYNVH